MDYQALYNSKLTTAAEAAKVVKSGDWVDYGWCTGTPVELDKALAARANELVDVNIRGGVLMEPLAIAQVPDANKHFSWNPWHMSGIERHMINDGIAFYAPLRYSELPRWYRESICPPDVVMIQVAPMDKHGYFNFGPNASHLAAVCETGKKVIVEVNKNMPRCLGGMENCVHISQVTGIVEGDNPPIGQMAAPGAATEVEMKEKKLRIEDALNATKAAVQEGVVAGGGTAPINAIPAVRALCDTLEGDERTGAKIVLKALEAPLRQIAKNAGLEGSVIIDKIISANKPNYGFDAQNEVFVDDMIAAGIVDPTKVTRSALENAASVAEMVLTTESLVADLPEPPAPAAPAGDMGGMGGMY